MERPNHASHHNPGERGTKPSDTSGPCPERDRITELERRVNNLTQQLEVVSNREPSTSIITTDVPRETFDDDRLEFIVKRINAVEARLVAVENRPYVAEETLNQLNDALHAKMQTIVERAVNSALGDLRSRVVTIEKRSTSHTSTSEDPESSKLGRISGIVDSLGSYVKEIETTVDVRHTELEQRYAELAEHITDNNLKTMKLSTRLYRALAALEHDEEAA